jgi:hypothetical protein
MLSAYSRNKDAAPLLIRGQEDLIAKLFDQLGCIKDKQLLRGGTGRRRDDAGGALDFAQRKTKPFNGWRNRQNQLFYFILHLLYDVIFTPLIGLAFQDGE